MKFLRFKKKKDNSKIKTGLFMDGKIAELKEDISYYFNTESNDRDIVKYHSMEDIEIEAPCTPSKIVCIGLNYKDHAKELGLELPKSPVIFIKANSTLNKTESNIIYPNVSSQVDYEGELAAVIGKTTKKADIQEAKDSIFGYTIINDVTARDFTLGDGQWTRGKSCDGFAPIGPFIETDLDPMNQKIMTKVNNQIKQDSNTKNMIFSPYEIISYISQTMTLNPGDIIATGTPPGVGPMEADSTVEVYIEDIGCLKNFLIKENDD